MSSYLYDQRTFLHWFACDWNGLLVLAASHVHVMVWYIYMEWGWWVRICEKAIHIWEGTGALDFIYLISLWLLTLHSASALKVCLLDWLLDTYSALTGSGFQVCLFLFDRRPRAWRQLFGFFLFFFDLFCPFWSSDSICLRPDTRYEHDWLFVTLSIYLLELYLQITRPLYI